MVSNKSDDEARESTAMSNSLPQRLDKLCFRISCLASVLALAAIAVALSRQAGIRDPSSIVSALSSLAVVVVALLALGQWKAQLRTRNRQSAASGVVERAYENHELFWEISRHVLQVLMNKTRRRQLVESDLVLQQHREIMLDYTSRVTSVGSRLQAELFKASIICGFKFPVDPSELVSMEATVAWNWMTSAFIRAQAFPEGSEERAAFLETEFSRVKDALDKAPETMREKREKLRRTLAPFFK